MIPRNHPQYIDIENFEDHELTICVAYEMAIRSPEVIEIINNNLYKNTYWYGIDLICKINLILDVHKTVNIQSLSEVKALLNHKDKSLTDALYNFLYINNKKIFLTTRLQEIYKKRDYTSLVLVKKFYELILQLQRDLSDTEQAVKHIDFGNDISIDLNIVEEHVSFYGAFRELENIGTNSTNKELSEIRQEIENFYEGLSEDEQTVIKKMIELNIDQIDASNNYNPLYHLAEEDAKKLRDVYYLNAYNTDRTFSMKNLYLKYTFIGIYDDRFKFDVKGDLVPEPIDPMDSIPEIDVQNEHFEIRRKRPLLRSAKVADGIILMLPEKEFEAQIESLRKQVMLRRKLPSLLNIYNLFTDIPDYLECSPSQEKSKMTDMFFLYDMMKDVETQQTINKQINIVKIKELKLEMKKSGLLLKDYYTDGMSFSEYINILKEKAKVPAIKDTQLNITNELIAYHNLVYVNDTKKTMSQKEHKEYEHHILNDSVSSAVSFPGMGRSSMADKYTVIKQFIDNGDYKKLL